MLKSLKRLFNRKGVDMNEAATPMPVDEQEAELLPRLPEQPAFIYCLVGNIKDERGYEEEDKTFKQLKYFTPGTKVYCFPPQWGDGYEKIKVVGIHRRSRRLIVVVIASKYVNNWRLKAVYNRTVIEKMGQAGWGRRESDKEDILQMAEWLNKR